MTHEMSDIDRQFAIGIVQSGILQIGYLNTNSAAKDQPEAAKPYVWHFEMLASYPDLLRTIVAKAQLICMQDTILPQCRLFAANSMIPVGVMLASECNIPLVYQASRHTSPVHDFIGAYDVGHPTYLIVDEINEHTSILIDNAMKVGLDIKHIIAIVGDGTQVSHLKLRQPIVTSFVFSWYQLIEQLVDIGYIPPKQAALMQSPDINKRYKT